MRSTRNLWMWGTVLLVVCLVMAGQASAITLQTTQQTLTSTQATFQLTLDFSDNLPADLAEVEAFNISALGSTPDLTGKLTFAAGSDWFLVANFGDNPSYPDVATLLWNGAGTGLQPGDSSVLGTLSINLAGLSGQTVTLKFDGGSDPANDETAYSGIDANSDTLNDQSNLSPAEIPFDVPPQSTGVPVPEPISAVLVGLAGLATLAFAARRSACR